MRTRDEALARARKACSIKGVSREGKEGGGERKVTCLLGAARAKVGERIEIKAESTPGRKVFQDLSQALDTLMDPPPACQVLGHLDARLQAELRAAPPPFPSIPAIRNTRHQSPSPKHPN
jgi:hypothetical protein